jgi:hypothetical protein
MKREVMKDILKGTPSPAGWGIDTFFTVKALIFGYTLGEIYLGLKMHNKKTLTRLRTMFNECFQEAVHLIKYFYGLPVRKKIQPLAHLPSPFEKHNTFDTGYMDIQKEVERSLSSFQFLKRMPLPHDDIFYSMKNVDTFDSFYTKTQRVNSAVWVEMLYWFVKKYAPDCLDQYYLRWKIRALSFCLHEINTVDQAEHRTRFQAKSAADFMVKIGEYTVLEKGQKSIYFYRIR